MNPGPIETNGYFGTGISYIMASATLLTFQTKCNISAQFKKWWEKNSINCQFEAFFIWFFVKTG